MKRIVTAAAALLAGVVPVLAQTTPNAPTASPPPMGHPTATPVAPPSNSSITTGSTNSGSATPAASAPLTGANSFTESQARSRLEGEGFKNLTGLKKDDQGIWRATATKDGKTQSVSLDYKGNIVANP